MKFNFLFPAAAIALAISLPTGADAHAHGKKVKHIEKVVVKGSTTGEDYQTNIRNRAIVIAMDDMTPVQAQIISDAAQEHCKCVKDAHQNRSTDGATLRGALADCAHKYQAAINGGKAIVTVEGETGAVVKIEANESDTDVLGRRGVATDVDNADAFHNDDKKGFENAR